MMHMGEVIYKNGDVVLDERGQNETCVAFLEKQLEHARNGEVVGVATAIQYADGSTGYSVAGFIRNQAIVGSLMFLVAKLTNG